MNNFKPYVGQKVRLNDEGYSQIGVRSREQAKAAENMTITRFANLNEKAPPGSDEIWMIKVDQPLMDMFMLDTTMVEPTEGLSGEARVLT